MCDALCKNYWGEVLQTLEVEFMFFSLWEPDNVSTLSSTDYPNDYQQIAIVEYKLLPNAPVDQLRL